MSASRLAWIQCLPTPTLILSSSGEVLAVNDACSRLLDLQQNDIVGRAIAELPITIIPSIDSQHVRPDWSSFLNAHVLPSTLSGGNGTSLQNGRKHTASAVAPNDDAPSQDEQCDDFWDDEEQHVKSSSLDVRISRSARNGYSDPNAINTAALDIGRSKMLRATMTVQSWKLDGKPINALSFTRPVSATNAEKTVTAPHMNGERELPVLGHPSRDQDAINHKERPSIFEKDKLSRNDEVYQIVGKIIPHVLAVLDPIGRVEYISPSWYEFTGQDPDSASGPDWAGAVHPDDVPAFREAWKEVLVSGSDDFTTEARYRRKDNCYIYFTVRCKPLKGADGRIINWYGSMIDVHESTLARISSDRRKMAMENVLSLTDVSLWRINGSHETVLHEGNLKWSQQGLHESERSNVKEGAEDSSDILGGLKRSKNADEVMKALEDVLQGSSSAKTIEHCIGDRWYRTSLVADVERSCGASDPARELARAALGLTIDISDVKARSALQLKNDQLKADEQAALQASRFKSQFVANMSHEIRTPISGIIGLNDLLLESPLNEDQKDLAEGVQQSANYLLTIVNDVLDFSKIESGYMDIEHIPFNLNALLTGIIQVMSLQAKKKDIELIYEDSNTLKSDVIGDPSRIRQILTNLLGNSIKFTNEGSVTLAVHESPVHSRNSSVYKSMQVTDTFSESMEGKEITIHIVIEDTGIGMSEGSLKTLFQPFQQADASISRRFGGTGLGLNISKQLVELMGGSLNMTSVEGVGSVASLMIPVRLSPETNSSGTGEGNGATVKRKPSPPMPRPSSGLINFDKGSSGSRRSSSAYTNGSFSPEKNGHDHIKPPPARHDVHILIAEDNAINQKIALRAVRSLGFSASAVWNGSEALSYLTPPFNSSRPRPNLILMDCMMPVMDGYETTRRLRDDVDRFDAQTRDLPVIALTASAIQGDKENCKAAGMDGFLSKPINKAMLEKTLIRWTLET